VQPRILKPAFRIPAAAPGMLGVMRIFTIGRGGTPPTGGPRPRVRLRPHTVRGRATAVVTLMTALALAVSAGVLLYTVRHELVGTALVEANDTGTTTGTQPKTSSRPTTGPRPGSSPVPDVQITEMPVATAEEVDFTLIDAAQDTMVRLLLIGIPLLLLLVAALTWLAMGRALRPVEAIRAEFAEITAHDLHRRVPDRRTGDEVSRLAATMNATLDQLQRAVGRLRTFTSDASHELRGPLTTLFTRLELAAARPAVADWPPVAAESMRDVEQLRQIVDDLLLLARLDAGQVLHKETFVVTDVVRDAIGDRAVQLCDDSAGQSMRGSRTAMRRLVTNLIDNATRYARSAVLVRLCRTPEWLIVEVVDDGPGIDSADRSRVFDRFVRLDEARTRIDGGGTGLGLAIAREIAAAHDGTLTADAPEPGHAGARFVLTLPTGRGLRPPA
jgi:signal transduction histidine kinase